MISIFISSLPLGAWPAAFAQETRPVCIGVYIYIYKRYYIYVYVYDVYMYMYMYLSLSLYIYIYYRRDVGPARGRGGRSGVGPRREVIYTVYTLYTYILTYHNSTYISLSMYICIYVCIYIYIYIYYTYIYLWTPQAASDAGYGNCVIA